MKSPGFAKAFPGSFESDSAAKNFGVSECIPWVEQIIPFVFGAIEGGV